MLNTDSTVFVMDNMNINNGYPVFKWQTVYDLATDAVTNTTSYTAQLHGHCSGAPDSVGFSYRANGSSDSTIVILPAATTPAVYTLTGLQPNTTYSCRFFAMKEGHTLFGSPQTFTTFPTYTVTVQSSNTALGTVSGSGTFGYGEIDTITASPVEHYQFTQWSDGNSDNPRYLTVTQSQTLTATFALAQHTVAVTANNTAWGTVSGGGTYNYGQTILLNATPSQGYHFTAWNDGDTVNPRVITVESNLSLTATFAPNQYNVSLYSNDPTKGTVSGGGVYSYGQQTYIIATPLGNYSFSQWSDGNTEAYRLITVTQDIAYTAIFTDATYTITAQSNNEQYGTVTGTGTYVGGSSVTLTATPYTGYNFVQWSDGNTDNPRTVTVTANATYTAQFAPNNYTVTATSADNTMGYVIGGGSYTYMSQITLEATAMPHYHFTQWSDGSTANPRIITVMGDATYTAQFAIDQHTVNVVSTDVSQGTATGGGSYDYGALVTITATAAEHYHFNQWSDGNTSNPRVITVTGDVTYSASFAPDSYTITVISSDNTMGYISGGGSFIYGTQTTIAATALPHHSFVQWNDGVTINPRTVTVTSDSSFTAIFSEEPRYTVTVVSEDPAKGSVTGGGQFYAGEQTVIMASAATNHLFDHWSDGSHDAMHTVIVTSDVTYTAYFSAVTYSVNVYSNDDNLGTVSGGGSFVYGQQATVTATPAAGCHFMRWSNGVETNPYTFTVYGDVNLIATFERNNGIESADDDNNMVVTVTGLRVRVECESGTVLRLYDMIGRMVATGIDEVQAHADGVYLLQCGTVIKKIVIIH